MIDRLPARIPGATILNRIDLPDELADRAGKAPRPFFNRAVNRGFDIRNAAGDEVEISLYDEVGIWGVTAADFRAKLNRVRNAARIVLRINSPGGDVFDGIAIHNDLQDHPAEIVVRVTGLAASAASIIAMAGDRVEMAPASFLMIHNAWALGIGDKHTMEGLREVLSSIDGALAGVYAARTGLSVDDVAEMMDDETWLNAERAVADGFADSAIADEDTTAANAKFDLSGFAHAPDGLGLPRDEAARPASKNDFERCLRDAGYSRTEAKAAAARVFENGNEALRDAGSVDSETLAALERLTATIAS